MSTFCLTTDYLTTLLLVRSVLAVGDAVAPPGHVQASRAVVASEPAAGTRLEDPAGLVARQGLGNHAVRMLDHKVEH